MGIQLLVTLGGTFLIMGSIVHQYGMGIFKTDQFHELLMKGMLQYMTGMVLLSNLLTILCFWMFFRFRHKSFVKTIGLSGTSPKNLVLSSFCGVGVCFFVDLMTQILPIPESIMDQFETQHGMLWFGDVGLTFLSVAIIGPVSEEICFRGLCYTRLKAAMRPWAAGLISSVFFGLAHGDPVWFLVGFAAGLFLSWVFETTGSLLCAIVVHVTNNALSSLTAYYPMSPILNRILNFTCIGIMVIAGFLLYKTNKTPNEE